MKLIIFDLDGTLVNSLDDLAAAANQALKKHGFPIHENEKYKYFVGNGVPKLIERALPENMRTDTVISMVKSDFDAYYSKHYADCTKPYDGINDLLRTLKERGYKLAVASNKPDEFTSVIVTQLFGDIFDFISGKREDTPKKPAPDIIFKIMKASCVNAENTVMIGDSDVDIITAENAGISSIGCLWGFRTADELKKAGADHLASSPSEILNFIIKEK